MSNKIFNVFNEVLNNLNDRFEHLNLIDSLAWAEDIGDFLAKNNSGILSLPNIELLLKEKALNEINYFNFSSSVCVNEVLFVITEPYNTGGHTRLMEHLSGYLNSNVDLLITRGCERSVLSRMGKFFNNVHLSNSVDKIEHLRYLIKTISAYEKIVLFIHPNDIRTVLACDLIKSNNKILQVFFVNHSVHSFSYGVSVADYWFQISSYGDKLDMLRNGLKAKKSFLGIPISIPFSSSNSRNVDVNNLHNIISAGDSHKYKPKNNSFIYPLLKKFLSLPSKPIVTIIGVNLLTDYWWWMPKLLNPIRLKLVKKLQFDEYIKLTRNSDVYIDSHPFPGGTAFVEQYLHGRYCVGLTTNLYGYSPIELLKKDTIDEVFSDMVLNQNTDYETINNMICDVHSPVSVSSRFNGTIEHGSLYENLNVKYIRDSNSHSVCFDNVINYVSPNVLIYAFKKPKLFLFLISKSYIRSCFYAFFRVVKRMLMSILILKIR